MLIGLGTKSGKIKIYGLKWKKSQNIGTKSTSMSKIYDRIGT